MDTQRKVERCHTRDGHSQCARAITVHAISCSARQEGPEAGEPQEQQAPQCPDLRV